MAKDRAPKETLKDKRTTVEKIREEAIETMEKADDMLKQFIKESKSKNKGNPKEAGASISKSRDTGNVKSLGKDIAGALARGLGRQGVGRLAGGGLAEATAKLKAKGLKEGGMVVKDKVVAIDKSPNGGLITTKGFGASRRT